MSITVDYTGQCD